MTGELLCHRCGVGLAPGSGFYVVRIEAFADPSLPNITRKDLEADLTSLIAQTLDEMRDLSERELADQVHRRLTLHLCRGCYERWIENPTG